MTDSLRVALGMACFQIRPADGSTEFLVNVLSGNTMDVDGRQEQVWRVRTNVGERFCSLTGAHASAYECNHAKDNPPMPEFGNVEGMTAAIKDGRLAQFKGPSVGKLLSRVPRESVIEMVELAKSYRMAAGLDLLMRRAGLATAEIMTVPVKIESGPLGIVCHWLALANRKAFLMEAASKGSALLELPDKTCRATVRAPEIEEHLTKAEDGNFAVM